MNGLLAVYSVANDSGLLVCQISGSSRWHSAVSVPRGTSAFHLQRLQPFLTGAGYILGFK